MSTDIKTTYTILNNGVINRTVKCKPSVIDIQLTTNEIAVEGDYPSNRYKYENGGFVALSDAEKPFEPTIFKSSKAVLVDLLEQLEQSGVAVPIHVEDLTQKTNAKKAIDQAAGRARFRLVSQGVLIANEYVLAEQEIKAWRDNGSPSNDIPICITDWIDAVGITPEQAAQDLETQAAAFKAVIFQIRNLRLKGKALVDSATDFQPVAEDYISQLNSILI